jgi:hypothetical protein
MTVAWHYEYSPADGLVYSIRCVLVVFCSPVLPVVLVVVLVRTTYGRKKKDTRCTLTVQVPSVFVLLPGSANTLEIPYSTSTSTDKIRSFAENQSHDWILCTFI